MTVLYGHALWEFSSSNQHCIQNQNDICLLGLDDWETFINKQIKLHIELSTRFRLHDIMVIKQHTIYCLQKVSLDNYFQVVILSCHSNARLQFVNNVKLDFSCTSACEIACNLWHNELWSSFTLYLSRNRTTNLCEQSYLTCSKPWTLCRIGK